MPSGLEGPGSSSSSGSSNSGAVKAAAQVLGEHHQLNYPCNSVSRDVVVFMEARKPVLCNNQKKIFMLRGNLHHDTSLFQGRAWLQIPAGKTWECCKYVTGGRRGGGEGTGGERGGEGCLCDLGRRARVSRACRLRYYFLTHSLFSRTVIVHLFRNIFAEYSLTLHSLERCLSTTYQQARGSQLHTKRPLVPRGQGTGSLRDSALPYIFLARLGCVYGVQTLQSRVSEHEGLFESRVRERGREGGRERGRIGNSCEIFFFIKAGQHDVTYPSPSLFPLLLLPFPYCCSRKTLPVRLTTPQEMILHHCVVLSHHAFLFLTLTPLRLHFFPPFPPSRCVKKSPAGLLDDPYKDDTAVASCSQSMWSFLEVSPDFAQLFYQLQSLPTDRKEEVFDRVSKRLKSTTNL